MDKTALLDQIDCFTEGVRPVLPAITSLSGIARDGAFFSHDLISFGQ
jgi:hypothetical protein